MYTALFSQENAGLRMNIIGEKDCPREQSFHFCTGLVYL
jgi:hypothetical protein